MAEHVQLPGTPGIGAHHVALEAEPVHGRPDGSLRTGQVRVRLVVGSADDLDAAGLDQGPELCAAVGIKVPVGLEVVHLGEDNLVPRVDPCPLEMGLDQCQPAVLEGLPAVLCPDQLVPAGGVAGLGVPPDRVVVEVGNHEHPPTWLPYHHIAPGLGPSLTGLHDGSDGHDAARGQRRVEQDRDLHHDPIGQVREPT